MTAPEWIVCFVPRAPGHPPCWWQPLIAHRPRWYQHCLLLRFDPVHKVWLVIDPSANRIEAAVMDRWDAMLAIAYVVEHGLALKIREAPAKRSQIPAPFVYCVSVVKKVLRRGGRAVTPWQLACALRREGALPTFDTDHRLPELVQHG